MKIVKKYPLLGSSADPEKLALSIKGFLLMLVPVITSVVAMFGLEVLQADLVGLIEQLFVIVGGVMTLIGLGRKFYLKYR